MRLCYLLIWRKDEDEEKIKERFKLYGCEKFYIDRIDRKADPRPRRAKMIDHLRGGEEVYTLELFSICPSRKEKVPIHDLFKELGVTLVTFKGGRKEWKEKDWRMHIDYIESETEFKTKNAHIAKRENRIAGNVGRPRGPHGVEGREMAFKAYALAQKVDDKGKPLYSTSVICKKINRSKSTYHRYIRWVESQTETNT